MDELVIKCQWNYWYGSYDLKLYISRYYDKNGCLSSGANTISNRANSMINCRSFGYKNYNDKDPQDGNFVDQRIDFVCDQQGSFTEGKTCSKINPRTSFADGENWSRADQQVCLADSISFKSRAKTKYNSSYNDKAI